MGRYKWSEKDIRAEWEARKVSFPPNLNKVRKYQRHTDDLEEVVTWAINSCRNDADERQRRVSHGTGAVA